MANLFPFVSVNGKLIPQEQAVIPAFTNGLLFGEGIFTTIKVKQSIPLFFDKHEQRLLRSMKQLGFSTYSLQFSLQKAVKDLIKKNELPDCVLRITVVNEKEQPLIIIQQREITVNYKPIKVITVPDTRDEFRTIKTINRLVNQKALSIAEKKGAQDAIFVRNESLIESTYCNIFSLNSNSQIITPNLDDKGLKGITREVIMENLTVTEANIPVQTNGPIVLVNSLRILKVSHLNDRSLEDFEILFEQIKSIIEKKEKQYLKLHSKQW